MVLESVLNSRFLKIVVAMALASAFTILPGQAQSFSVIHAFTNGTDGAGPLAGLVMDSSQNLYGTASSGGSLGYGVVFKMARTGTESVLHTFAGGETDGANPQSRLIMDQAGNLYGTTFAGGTAGVGTVFMVTTQGKEKLLYSFKGGSDGANPYGALVMDPTGNLYGTTTAGGTYGLGTAFEIKSGQEQVLFNFGEGDDGATPIAGLTFDAKGNLYGTASAGGTYGDGTIFELVPSQSGWKEVVLHDFAMLSDGGTPYGGLVYQGGNLYGAATDGGGEGGSGGGTVFELTPSGRGWTFNVVYGLAGWGISGTFRDVMFDASGNLYATTHCDGADDAGTVYELTPSAGTWTYTSLYVFSGGSDGMYAFSNLVLDKQGNLYGTTNTGGPNGFGDVFKVKP